MEKRIRMDQLEVTVKINEEPRIEAAIDLVKTGNEKEGDN